MRIVYLNGTYVPENQAQVSVFDRGFLFADAVYEVIPVLASKLVDYNGHINRLYRSLNALDITISIDSSTLLNAHQELIARNNVHEGLVYMHITRGAIAQRDFVYPSATKATVVLFTQDKALLDAPNAKTGINVKSCPDLRWRRCDIKTVQLLYPSLAKTEAHAQGYDDAWLVDNNGYVTEGTSSNAYIIKNKCLITRALSQDILAGVTRAAVLNLLANTELELDERSFTLSEAKNADEAFITSATTFVTPVISIDDSQIGTSGKPGAMSLAMRDLYIQAAQASLL